MMCLFMFYFNINLGSDLFYLAFFVFYGDDANFISSVQPWAYHGANWRDGVLTGEFAFSRNTGLSNNNHGSRLVNGTIM